MALETLLIDVVFVIQQKKALEIKNFTLYHNISDFMEAPPAFEPENKGFAELSTLFDIVMGVKHTYISNKVIFLLISINF